MNQEEIKTKIEELLKYLPVTINNLSVEFNSPERIICSMESPEGSILIGNGGETLHAINHLLRRMVEKNNSSPISIVLDINGYRKATETKIKNIAEMLGARALSFKSEVVMEPGDAFERRAVHTLFENHPNLETESRGFGRERHVVIRYVENKTLAKNEESFID